MWVALNMIYSARKKIYGFSLIEIAIALTIAGLLMAGVIEATRVSTISAPVLRTRANFEEIEIALQKFLAANGRLPCPSRPDLRDSDVGAGLEVCDNETFNEYSRLKAKAEAEGEVFSSVVIPSCNDIMNADAGSGLCYIPNNGRDADADGLNNDDMIYQGGVPYKTLGLLPSVASDGWDVALRYVVTERLMDTDSYNKDFGAIYVANSKYISKYIADVEDYRNHALDNNADDYILNRIYPAPYGSAQYLLVSSGRNRAGAYIFSGVERLVGYGKEKYDCTAGIYSETSIERMHFGLDFENCNQDEFFLSDDKFALMGDSKIQLYLDDLMHDDFTIEPYSNGVWKFNGAIVKPQYSASVRNHSGLARVGIGTDVPSAPLDVKGNLKSESIYTKELCDSSSGECMKPSSLLYSASCSGGTGGLLVSVDDDGGFKCMNSTFVNGVERSCSAIIGIDFGGAVICAED